MITQEKTIHSIEGFDKHQLKHAETEVKNPLPDKQSEWFMTLLDICPSVVLYIVQFQYRKHYVKVKCSV